MENAITSPLIQLPPQLALHITQIIPHFKRNMIYARKNSLLRLSWQSLITSKPAVTAMHIHCILGIYKVPRKATL